MRPSNLPMAHDINGDQTITLGKWFTLMLPKPTICCHLVDEQEWNSLPFYVIRHHMTVHCQHRHVITAITSTFTGEGERYRPRNRYLTLSIADAGMFPRNKMKLSRIAPDHPSPNTSGGYADFALPDDWPTHGGCLHLRSPKNAILSSWS